MKGPNAQEFVEPKVQGLWKLALEGNFTPEELYSLKVFIISWYNLFTTKGEGPLFKT